MKLVSVPSIASIKSGGETILLDNFPDASVVTASVDWDDLDALDGSVKLQQRMNSEAKWCDITNLHKNLNYVSGTVKLTRYDWVNGELGLFINPGSCTQGRIKIFAEGK